MTRKRYEIWVADETGKLEKVAEAETREKVNVLLGELEYRDWIPRTSAFIVEVITDGGEGGEE
ncbi:MAG: hypothetical protein QXO02_10245 [Thermofilaceae archaeon]